MEAHADVKDEYISHLDFLLNPVMDKLPQDFVAAIHNLPPKYGAIAYPKLPVEEEMPQMDEELEQEELDKAIERVVP